VPVVINNDGEQDWVMADGTPGAECLGWLEHHGPLTLVQLVAATGERTKTITRALRRQARAGAVSSQPLDEESNRQLWRFIPPTERTRT
jgi:hypothetical protein